MKNLSLAIAMAALFTTSAHAVTPESNVAWAELVNRLSARGIKVDHQCSAVYGTCTYSMHFTKGGVHFMLLEIEAKGERIVERQICQFNHDNLRRRCVVFDEPSIVVEQVWDGDRRIWINAQ